MTRADNKAVSVDLYLAATPCIKRKLSNGQGIVVPPVSPGTGRTIDQMSTANASDHEMGLWLRMHPSARKDVLIGLYKYITRRQREMAVMESIDSGKPIRECARMIFPKPFTVRDGTLTLSIRSNSSGFPRRWRSFRCSTGSRWPIVGPPRHCLSTNNVLAVGAQRAFPPRKLPPARISQLSASARIRWVACHTGRAFQGRAHKHQRPFTAMACC